MVPRNDALCLPQRRKPPLNLKVLAASDAFYDSAFFYEQLELAWLFVVSRIAIKLRCEIDAPGREPIPLYDTLVRSFFPVFPACPRRHVNHLFFLRFWIVGHLREGFLSGGISVTSDTTARPHFRFKMFNAVNPGDEFSFAAERLDRMYDYHGAGWSLAVVI